MSSFIAKFSILSVGGSFSFVPGPPNQYQIDTNTASGIVTYTVIGNVVSLDGGAPISLQSLPSGWQPLGAPSIRRTGGSFIGRLRRGDLTNGGKSIVNYGVYGPTNTLLTGVTTLASVAVPTLSGPFPSAIDLAALLTVNLSITGNVADASLAAWVFDSLEVFGNYQILGFTYTLTNDKQAIYAGDTVTITSNNANGFAGVTLNTGAGNSNLVVQYQDQNGILISLTVPTINITLLTATVLQFIPIPYPPLSPPPDNTIIYFPIPGDGIQFSGSVLAGSRLFLIAHASGIYRIVKDKRNDTIYNKLLNAIVFSFINFWDLEDELVEEPIMNPTLLTIAGLPEDEELYNNVAFMEQFTSVVIPGTSDIMIPSPFIKTGFIGG